MSSTMNGGRVYQDMNINLLDKRNLPNLKDFSEIENPLCLRPFQEEKEAKPVWGTNVIERSI